MTTNAVPWRCPPRTVLVAVDFSEPSARAAALAGLIASAFDATLRVMHSQRFEPPPYFTVEQIARLEAERRGAEIAAAGHLAQFVAAATAYPVEAIVVDEPPVEAILHASTQADLVVMGSRRRRRPVRWWLGSVAERVVRAAAVPVLVTHGLESAAIEVFERVVLIGDSADPGESARECAGTLASTFHGRLEHAGPLAECEPDRIAQASLVVVASADARGSWGLSDLAARTLGACERPALFVPSRMNL